MEHLDPETLALLALGEDAASATERLHLAGCPECRAELARYARPVAAARGIDEPLAEPGPAVWAGIAAALELDAAAPASVEVPRPRAPRLRRRVVAVIASAAAVLVVGGVGVGLLSVRNEAERIASATLHPFPGWRGSSGTAVLERLPDGRRVVEVTTTVAPQAGSDHEVWLMTAGAKRLVSLGLLHGETGTFAVPAGVDLSRFRLVDVSDEPHDGNPAHSGDSIIRGTLRS